MRGITELVPARSILKQMRPVKGAMGRGITMKYVDNKQGNSDFKGGGGAPTTDDKAEPIAAFSKPPLPPVLGPIAALSLLEIGSNHDGNED